MGRAMAVWCLDVEFQALSLPVVLKEKKSSSLAVIQIFVYSFVIFLSIIPQILVFIRELCLKYLFKQFTFVIRYWNLKWLWEYLLDEILLSSLNKSMNERKRRTWIINENKESKLSWSMVGKHIQDWWWVSDNGNFGYLATIWQFLYIREPLHLGIWALVCL